LFRVLILYVCAVFSSAALPCVFLSITTKQAARRLHPGGPAGGTPGRSDRGERRRSLQLHDGDAALPFAVTAQAEALDVPVAPQMLLDGGAQSAGAVAVDQVDGGLSVQDGVVDEGIRLLDRFVHGQAQQVALHLGLPPHPLEVPAVSAGAVAGLAGIA